MRLKEFLRDGGESNTAKNWKNTSIENRIKYVKSFLHTKGYSKNQIGAIIGNLMQENSTLDPNTVNQIGAVGIAQWLSKDRKNGLLSKNNPYSIVTQLNYLHDEIQGKHSGAWTNNVGGKNAFMDPNKNIKQLTYIFRKDFERPGEHEANDENRQRIAHSITNETYTPFENFTYSENHNPYFKQEDMSEYMEMFKNMQQQGSIDYDKLNQSYQKFPEFTQIMFNNFKDNQQFVENQKLEQERLQQEDNKKRVELENQRIQSALLQKEQEKQTMLSMIPQAQSVTSGNITPSFMENGGLLNIKDFLRNG